MTQRARRTETRPAVIPRAKQVRTEPRAVLPASEPVLRGTAAARLGVDKPAAELRSGRRPRAEPARRQAPGRNSIRAWRALRRPRPWRHRGEPAHGPEQVWPLPFSRISPVSRRQVWPCACGRRAGGVSFRPQRRRKTVYRRRIWEGGPCRDFRIMRHRARAASDAGAQAKFQAATRALAKRST